MDTSETYIKMSDHPKIQDDWKPRIGDYIMQRDRLFRPIGEPYVHTGGGLAFLPVQANHIWLPRQDKIQEMMCDDVNYEAFALGVNDEDTIFELLFSRLITVYESGVFIGIKACSGEQLWLIFYMHEFHKLKWDGKKWVKDQHQNINSSTV